MFLAHLAADGREVPVAAVNLVVRAFNDFEADSIERLSGRVLPAMREGAPKAQLRIVPGRARKRFSRVMIDASIGVFDSIYIIVLSGRRARCFSFAGRDIAHLVELLPYRIPIKQMVS